jgi:predicted component of type VI protein secretion system
LHALENMYDNNFKKVAQIDYNNFLKVVQIDYNNFKKVAQIGHRFTFKIYNVLKNDLNQYHYIQIIV